MSSPAAIHASHSQQQDTEKEQTMTATSGPTSETPFAQWDQSSQSWKTSEDTSLWGSVMYSPTLPTTGSMRNGQLYQQPPLERPTAENVSSLLPTPRAQNGETRNMNIWARPAGQPQNLENALALIGDSTNQPSNDGDTFSDDQHQTPQLWDQQADLG
jgi:hypothetical protein